MTADSAALCATKNMTHLTFPEIKDFNALGDKACVSCVALHFRRGQRQTISSKEIGPKSLEDFAVSHLFDGHHPRQTLQCAFDFRRHGKFCARVDFDLSRQSGIQQA